MIKAVIYNAWGRPIGEQMLSNPRAIALNPFPTWQYVIFRSEKTGVILDMFLR